MEITEQNQQDVEQYLKNNKDGVTANELECNCDSLFNRLHLSRTLHYMTKLCIVHKVEDKYFLVDEKKRKAVKKVINNIYDKDVVKNNKPSNVRVHFWERKHITSHMARMRLAEDEQIPAQGSPVKGFLNKESMIGNIAIAFFILRNEQPILIDDIIAMTGYKKQSAYTFTLMLINKGFISRKHKLGRMQTYTWSGRYSYPFPTKSDLDIMDLKMTLAEFKYYKAKNDIEIMAKRKQHMEKASRFSINGNEPLPARVSA